MITVNLFRNGENFSQFNINISHIREKNTTIEQVALVPIPDNPDYLMEKVIKYKVFDQFGGYTIGAYTVPDEFNVPMPHGTNRIVISRCSPKDNYDRHKGIMCCIEKVVEKLWPEENFTLVPMFNELGRLISADKTIRIDLQ